MGRRLTPFVSLVHRLQQYSLNNDKKSPNIVDDDASSCDNDQSESEEPDEGNLRLVIVKSTLDVLSTLNRWPLSLPFQSRRTRRRSILVRQRPLSAIRRNLSFPDENVAITFPTDRRRGLPARCSPSRRRSSPLLASVNLWNIIKNCVGKDLTKIPVPVNFSEPLSMLQRVTEELEYSSVLDMAAKAKDNWEQLAYVAAFTVSAYSTTSTRANKPFNPLLGETYECDRTDDFGWRSMAGEIVSLSCGSN